MKKIKKLGVVCAAAAISVVCGASASAESSGSVNIEIDISKDRKPISRYIYGINSEQMGKDVGATAIRAGGNRFTAYNWETNASNAGNDMRHISDSYFNTLCPKTYNDKPGNIALYLSERCKQLGGAYSLMTIPMAGYVSADTKGEVKQGEAAPSARFDEVVAAKGSEFSLEPDTGDGKVYMDEFVNYCVQNLGDASSETGIKGYSLDNEPSLWKSTHPRVHRKQTTCEELITKSVEMAKAIKAVDPKAEIFGPALYGYAAFDNLGKPSDWQKYKNEYGYEWFVDLYLDQMHKAEQDCGERLIDVFDIHYYTEAKGPCDERSCNHYEVEECVDARLNAPRSLWDASYREHSWIGDNGAKFFPLLPRIRESIDKYYPGTKLAITEYDFGAPFDITGGIEEADALGIFAKNEVYFASLFSMNCAYQLTAIDLYTNYDYKGSGFGDTLVYCESDNIEKSFAYASVDEGNDDIIKLVISNKSFGDKTEANIKLPSADYKYCHLYGMNGMAAKVMDMKDNNPAVKFSGDTLTYTMEPRTVSLLVISKEPVPDKPDPSETESGTDPIESSSSSDRSEGQKEESTHTNMLPIIIGGAGAAVLAVGGAVLAIRKKKK